MGALGVGFGAGAAEDGTMGSMKLPQRKSGKPWLSMPLWLQGVVEAILINLCIAVVLIALMFWLGLSGAVGAQDAMSALVLAGQSWLLLHGVPLELSIRIAGDDLSGTLSLIPLGLTLLLIIPWFFAGRRLARASYEKQFWQPLLAAALAQALIGFATATACRNEVASAPLLAGTLVPVVVAVVGILAGAYREVGSWDRIIGVNAADWVARTSQYSRWAGSYVWAGVKAAFVAVLCVIGLSAALLAVMLAVHWADIVTIYERLQPGLAGGIVLTLAQLGYFPNLMTWTMAYSSGAGFYAGTGNLVSPLSTQLSELPAVPVLAAIPESTSIYALAVLVLPVIAGLLGGWWFYRAGENHLDEWLSLKTRVRWLSWSVSSLVAGVLMGFVAMLCTSLIAWLGSGGAGFGRLADFGADPLRTGVYLGVEVAFGAFIGIMLGPWMENERHHWD